MDNSECFQIPECASTSMVTSTGRTCEAMEVDEEEEEDKEFEKLLWSIDDDTLFQPLGLTNHGTDAGKTVFVTWNEDYLLNFVFKRARRSKKISLTKVRIPMPAGEIVHDIFILEMNALLLMRSGRVYYFSSVKSMHAVDWLNDAGAGVRCMAAAPTAGFSCIRYIATQSALTMEMYRDAPDIGRSTPTLLQRCDITFDDRNVFNCSWEDERYTIASQPITESNLDFLHHLLMEEVELKVGQWLHIFTVSCIVYALVVASLEEQGEDAANCEYSIHQLCAYATNIDSIQLDCEEKRCLIFLQCGSIDIWYYSHFTCGLRRMPHHTGAQYSHHVYVPNARCFYFTDEQQVAQLHFSYDAEEDCCQVQETYKAVPGMVACTWVDTQQQLICLSCNNIFYKMKFDPAPKAKQPLPLSTSTAALVSTEYENLQMLYELTPARLSRLLARAQKVNELVNLPAQMHAAVEQECVKQQLLGVASNREFYRYLAKAHLVYSIQLPTAPQDSVIILYANNNYQLHHDSYVALIYLQIERNDVLHSGDSLWHLYIDVDRSDSYMLHVPSALLEQQLCIVLPLKREVGKLLAHIKLKLYTCYVTICNDYDITKLIRDFLKCSQNETASAKANEALHFEAAENDPKFDGEVLSHSLRLPSSCAFSTIAASFKVPIEDEQMFALYFMSTAVKVVHMVEEKYIKIESVDAVALYYVKMQLLISQPKLFLPCDEKEADSRQQQLVQFHCDLTRCGSALLQVPSLDEDIVQDESDTIPHAMQLQQLEQIYKKLRRDFHKLYS